MNYVEPKETILTVTHNGTTYTKKMFTPATLITNVTDEAHSNWSTSAVAVGDYRIVPELKTIYRATSAHSDRFPPAYPADWVDWGQINSYRCFTSDENIGSKTIGTNIVMEFNMSRLDTIGLVDITFTSVLVEYINNDTLVVVSSETLLGRDIGCLDFATYFYTDYKQKSALIIDSLEWLPNAKLRLTFSGYAEIGSIVHGLMQNFGITLMGTSLSLESNSKISVNEINGFRTVLRYGSINVLDARAVFDADDYDDVAVRAGDLIDKNILWIPTIEDKFSSMITIGYIESFPMPLDNASKVFSNIKIVGVR